MRKRAAPRDGRRGLAEAEAVAEIAAPFVTASAADPVAQIDWDGLDSRMGALETALATYAAHLQALQDEEDELTLLLVA